MRRGPIPLDAHAAVEPIMAIVLIAAPCDRAGRSDVATAR
jgi:hypothetical protein